MSNLPDWPGADGAYKRAYNILANMAKDHVEIIRWGKKPVGSRPSEEMLEIIDALNVGDEERIKCYNIQYRHYDMAWQGFCLSRVLVNPMKDTWNST